MATAYGVFIQDVNRTKCYPETRLELVHRGPGYPVDRLVPYQMTHKRVGVDSVLEGTLPDSGRCVLMFFTSAVFGYGNGSLLLINGVSYDVFTCRGEPVFDDKIFAANVLASISIDIDAKKAFLTASTVAWDSISGRPVDFRPKSHASIDGSYGRATETLYGHVKSASVDPSDLGEVAFRGAFTDEYARADHVHKLPDNVKAAGLQKPIFINGIAFDGTKDITISDDTKIPRILGSVRDNQIYAHDGQYGLNMANSDIIGINGMYFSDVCSEAGECISFATPTANVYDRLYANGGNLYFQSNAGKAENLAGTEVLVLRGYSVAGQFDKTETSPTSEGNRLNYNGDFYATRIYNAVWNDYAEVYTADAAYEPGTVLSIDPNTDEHVCTISKVEKDTNVFGVVSDEYGVCLGDRNAENANIVALCGRVHVKVIGTCKKGDYLVTSSTPGVAMAIPVSEMTFGIGFARVLETKTDEGVGKVLCAVYQGV